MGRYYQGDIEGKFWFGVQGSDAADRFDPTSNHYEEDDGAIYYEFSKDTLSGVIAELQEIFNTIGQENMEKLDTFFENTGGYNDEIMQEHGVLEIWKEHKSDYADFSLGTKIKECLEEQSNCEFEAEC